MKRNNRLLVVDDDRRMVKTLCDIVKLKGYDPVPVYSGEEALEQVSSGSYRCALMDIRMTGMDGIDTLRIMKKRAPGLPVVLMSGHATFAQKTEARRLGAYAVLDKPLDMPSILLFLSALMKEKTVLIIDDDPAFCRTLKDILESMDYRVETGIDPARAMDSMKKEYKLVVLLDLKLRSRNSTDVLKTIREKYPSKPVILVTAYGKDMADAINRSTRIEAYACMYKPLEIETLSRHIEDIDRLKLQNLLGETTGAEGLG
jgi:DNA-binding NtrC family response regulator